MKGRTVLEHEAASVTLVNTFTVRSERQVELLEALEEVTRRSLRHQPGFLGAVVHRSVDGKHVLSYSQWRSRADVEALQKDPSYREHTAQAAGLAERFEPVLYAVASVHKRWPNGSLPYSPDIFVSL
ncbi:MAG TPA: antibiotic biosynthesis monooxygenase family protein [Steroidobacteraceae bacterium]|nr:antibiotic biosynthesis monooxygenase family protein [Steroidobacteraceae bacterium]